MMIMRQITLPAVYDATEEDDPSLPPCSVYTRFLLSHPGTSCSPRQLKSFDELRRLAAHLDAWRDGDMGEDIVAVVREGSQGGALVDPDALRTWWARAAAGADVVLLGYAATGTPAGRLMYAATGAARAVLRRSAVPAEQTVDWLILTLAETGALRVARWPVSLTGDTPRPLTAVNLKEILPDAGVLSFGAVVVLALLLGSVVLRAVVASRHTAVNT